MHNPLHISIPEPCHENWQNMTPNEQGRHCMSCQKTVVDFSLMSDREILNYLSTAGSRVCGRFNNHQLEKTYEEPRIRRSFSWRYVWNMLVATFLVSASANTVQAKKPTQGEVVVTKRTIAKTTINTRAKTAAILPESKLTGIVVDDSTGKPIPFASLRIKGEEAGIAADTAGKFQLTGVASGKFTLIVSAVGYATIEQEVDASVPGSVWTFRMAVQADNLKPVEDAMQPKMGKVVCTSTITVKSVGMVVIGKKVPKTPKRNNRLQ